MVLTNIPRDPLLDLDPWVGQRACSFRFYVTDAVTREQIGEIHPIRGASLTHDTGRTIKRQLQMNLGRVDTAALNPVTDRVSPYMVFGNGASYPLGRYMFSSMTYTEFTSGDLSTAMLYDEMFLVDQQIKAAFNPAFLPIDTAVHRLLSGLPITHKIASSTFTATGAWTIGNTRGQILEALAVTGDYFSPWFDNTGVLRMIRTFNPAMEIADLDLDNGNRVYRSNITRTSDLLTAPNTIIVISNSESTATGAIAATATIPVTAPNSVANRGFEITQTFNLQLTDSVQAQAVANGIAQRAQVAERVTLTTPPDPRHDSYNIIRWRDANWLELSWSMALIEGGTMNHLLRKAYN